jgi:pyruvate formate lyase activating enzyme
VRVRIGGLQRTSLIDYPGLISCILFTQGCNFRCGYCHNPELLDPSNWEEPLPVKEILDFLHSRKGKLDAVVVTGGEPSLHPDLPLLLKEIGDMGFKVKLDTNGTNPEMLSDILEEGLADYVAMDIKAPLNKYSLIVGRDVRIDSIVESIRLIIEKAPDYEFRTTVVEGQLDFQDILDLGRDIKGAKRYYLQNFIPTKTCLPEFMEKKAPEKQIMEELRDSLLEIIPEVSIR